MAVGFVCDFWGRIPLSWNGDLGKNFGSVLSRFGSIFAVLNAFDVVLLRFELF